MKYLWEDPKLVSILLLNSDNKDVKEYLAPFICNYFYNNILSPYNVEENLLYIISIMLTHEINELNSENQIENFLNQTPCGYLLDELKKKEDIQNYCKISIDTLIEKIESTCSEKILNLDTKNIEDEIKKFENNYLKKQKKKIENIEDIIFIKDIDYEINIEDEKNKNNKNNKKSNYLDAYQIRNEKQNDLFNEKYVSSLDKKQLENFLTKYENQNDMKNYISNYVEECNNDTNLFSNEKLIEKLYNSKHSKILFTLYQIDFLKIVKLLDLLINSFIKNIEIVPNSVKSICKIIIILITRKFPKLRKFKQNAFVAQFLINKLFIPIFQNPNEIYINNFIISNNTISNLKLILKIFSQLNFGNFYNNSENQFNYTPFNWYFIDKMPNIFRMYENIAKIELPKFIDNLINHKLSKDYKYNYFNENQDEIIFHRSICFTLKDIFFLINNMDKNKEKLFPENINNNIINTNIKENNIINNINNDKNNKKNESKLYLIFKKLNSDHYRKLINNMDSFEIVNEKSNKKTYFVLIYDLLINPKFSNLFDIKQIKPHFYMKELSKIKNEEDSKLNNIIKIKNYLSGLLYNCKKLNKLDFAYKKNTIEFLKKIKIFLKTNQFAIENTIPNEWYVKFLLDCLNKLPEEYSNNDYQLLFNELKNDIKSSINFLDFGKLSDCFEKLKNSKKNIEYFKQLKQLIIDFDLNQKVKIIIEQNIIPFEMSLRNNKGKIEFLITKITKKKDLSKIEITQNNKLCENITQFIKYFPNLVNSRINKNIKIFEKIEKLDIPEKVNDYIDAISNKINEKKNYKEEELQIIKDKLYDYIMNKLYDKLYPKSPDKSDLSILNNCIKLSWTEPKHFIEKAKDNNYDIFMDDIKQLFDKLIKEKSPRKKLLIISEIFQNIYKIIKFNDEEGNSGADDNLNLLLYIFVKSQPNFINTDINYIQLFNKKQNGIEENQLFQLLSACNIMKDFKLEYLTGVKEEEYNQKCELALKGKNNILKEKIKLNKNLI